MTERERIIITFQQEQPGDIDEFAMSLLGARAESEEYGLIECGCIICDKETGHVTETHWFKVLQ